MRKIMKLIFIISVLLLSLVGCASETVDATKVEETKVEETQEEDTKEEETKEEETQEELTTETVVEVEIPKAYDMILDNIYNALQLNPVKDEIDSVHFSMGIQEVVVSGDTVDDRMKAIAYCVMDVNMDGVEELLIVDTVYPEPGNVRILDMYTLVEGTSVRVIEGWARNRYYLLDDGMIYCSSSGGAAYSNEELLAFAPGATKLTSKELYFTYPKHDDMNNCGYYYSANGEYDVSVATEISADDFQLFANDCENRTVTFDAKTFDLFK